MKKRILSLIMVVASLFALTSCGGNPDVAKWSKYDDKTPFSEVIRRQLIDSHEGILDVEVTTEKGWKNADENLDLKEAQKGEREITYVATIKYADDETEIIYFFMTITKEDALSFAGTKEIDGENTFYYNEDETIEKLNGEF